eukprot:TRINITY_DN426_c0_g1_i2.p1 TRINITY_DN426_c0_g1~~TRINITY_DN426_c0_g1_i2.p1  ORF type:complete len:510 (+),score=49.80 TRINITY_DN426_c0_g1_i2:168-1697(+)
MEAPFALVLLIVGGCFAFLLAFGIGANDVANSIGTSVGSGAISLKKALVIAAVFEMLGATTMGSLVSATIKSAIISPEHPLFDANPALFALGMFSAVASSSLWLLFASFLGLPVSTTHTIIGGILAFASLEAGWQAINLAKVINIVLSWVVSPALGGLLAFLLYGSIHLFILKAVDPYGRAMALLPLYYAGSVAVLVGIVAQAVATLVSKSPWALAIAFGGTALIALATGLVTKWALVPWLRRRDLFSHHRADFETDEEDLPTDSDPLMRRAAHKSSSGGHTDFDTVSLSESEGRVALESDSGSDSQDAIPVDLLHTKHVQTKFKYLMILSAVFIAYVHGANDIANAVAPYGVLLEYYRHGDVRAGGQIPVYVILGGGVGIVVGLAVLGKRVMQTVGEKIVKLSFSRGFAAQLGTAMTVAVGTALKLPISTSSVLVGAVTGVGLIKGADGTPIQWKILIKICLAWVGTLLVGYAITAGIYFLLKLILHITLLPPLLNSTTTNDTLQLVL